MQRSESGFLSQPLRTYIRDRDADYVVSRLRARIAESTVRIMKGLLKVAVDTDQESGDPVLTDVLPEVLHTYNYENKHSAIGMTPADAREQVNEFEARPNLEISRKFF